MYRRWIKNIYSRGNSRGRVDVLAIVFKGKKVYRYAFNKYCSGNKLARSFNSWTTHAEMSVLQDFDADDMSIVIYREDFYGNPMLAKPCIACERIINDSRIKKVIYSIPNIPYFVEELR